MASPRRAGSKAPRCRGSPACGSPGRATLSTSGPIVAVHQVIALGRFPELAVVGDGDQLIEDLVALPGQHLAGWGLGVGQAHLVAALGQSQGHAMSRGPGASCTNSTLKRRESSGPPVVTAAWGSGVGRVFGGLLLCAGRGGDLYAQAAALSGLGLGRWLGWGRLGGCSGLRGHGRGHPGRGLGISGRGHAGQGPALGRGSGQGAWAGGMKPGPGHWPGAGARNRCPPRPPAPGPPGPEPGPWGPPARRATSPPGPRTGAPGSPPPAPSPSGHGAGGRWGRASCMAW